jgi:hypothetical protein
MTSSHAPAGRRNRLSVTVIIESLLSRATLKPTAGHSSLA